MSKAWPILFFAALLFVAAVVTVALTRPERKVVHDRTVITTPIVSSPTTPLPRDSGPRNNKRASAAKKESTATNRAPIRTMAKSSPQAQKRRVPVKTRKTPRPKPKPQNGTQSPPSAPQPQPSHPLVGVTVPAPVSACVDRLAGVNCP